jgi:hypothetical protein
VRPAHSALRGRRLYLLSLTGADACHRMMRRSGMHPMWGPVGLACAPNVGCAGHVLMYTRMAPRPGGRRWRGPAVLAVRTELIADATDISRDAPRYAANLQMSAEMHRGSPRSTVTRGVGGKLRCTSSLCRGGPAQLWHCARTQRMCADSRFNKFQNTFILLRLGV